MSRKKPIPFDIDSFQEETSGWSDEQAGAYVRLLVHQWANGSIPGDIPSLSAIIQSAVRTWPRINNKFLDNGYGTMINPALDAKRRKAMRLNSKKSVQVPAKPREEVTTLFGAEEIGTIWEKFKSIFPKQAGIETAKNIFVHLLVTREITAEGLIDQAGAYAELKKDSEVKYIQSAMNWFSSGSYKHDWVAELAEHRKKAMPARDSQMDILANSLKHLKND